MMLSALVLYGWIWHSRQNDRLNEHGKRSFKCEVFAFERSFFAKRYEFLRCAGRFFGIAFGNVHFAQEDLTKLDFICGKPFLTEAPKRCIIVQYEKNDFTVAF